MSGRDSPMRCCRCGAGPERGFILFRSDGNKWHCAVHAPAPEVLPRQLTTLFGTPRRRRSELSGQ